MSIQEFMLFVAVTCNLDLPPSKVSRDEKEICMEYYVNCAVKEADRIDKALVEKCFLERRK